jgi:hypothetical protein
VENVSANWIRIQGLLGKIKSAAKELSSDQCTIMSCQT